MARQFVVQLDNRPGELAHVARALATRGVHITHLSFAGAGPVGSAFLTTDDDDATRAVLRGFGNRFIEGEMIVVEVEDRPGVLAEVTERLARAGVNILGMLIVSRCNSVVEIALAVDDEAAARRAVADIGQTVLA